MPAPAAVLRVRGFWFTPYLAPILEKRVWSGLAAAFLLGNLWMEAHGSQSLGCILRDNFGVSCPGCGLSLAARYLMAGQWRESFTAHPFLAVFLSIFGTLLLNGMLPSSLRSRIVSRVAAWEQRTGGMLIIAVAVLLHWLIRL